MNNRLTGLRTAVAVTLLFAAHADAATYWVLPSETDVLAGATTALSVEVETEAGENVVDVGYFSFAIDLTLTGAAGAAGSDISNVVINETDFDDLSSISLGFPQGNQYRGIAGVTTDIFPPTFGETVGDITCLFHFDLMVPVTAELGDTITIIPSEGALENLIANASFDNVAPQTFQPATLTIIPEPSTLTLFGLAAAGTAMFRQRRRPVVTSEGVSHVNYRGKWSLASKG